MVKDVILLSGHPVFYRSRRNVKQWRFHQPEGATVLEANLKYAFRLVSPGTEGTEVESLKANTRIGSDGTSQSQRHLRASTSCPVAPTEIQEEIGLRASFNQFLAQPVVQSAPEQASAFLLFTITCIAFRRCPLFQQRMFVEAG